MIASFPLIWFSLEPPSSHHPSSSSSSSSKTKKHSSFCSWHCFQVCCLLPESSAAHLCLYFKLKRSTSCMRSFKQNFFPVQRAAFALFLVLAAASRLCWAPKRCDGRHGHLKEPVVSFASCYKWDSTNSESLPLPTLPSQLCFIGTLSRIFLPTTQRVAIICFS